MDYAIDSDNIIKNATLSFNKSKKYIRKKDMTLFLRCKFLNKKDMDFLEEFALIHIKNIQHGSKIPQNFHVVLDNFIFNNLFTKHFFTSMEMLRLICYRFYIASYNILLKDVKYHLRSILCENVLKIPIYKKAHNTLYFLQPLPNLDSEIDFFLQKSIHILSQQHFDGLVINPLNLIINPEYKDSQSFIKVFSKNLQILLDNANAKMIILDNNHEFFYEILESVCMCVQNIAYPISIAISLPSYHLHSLKMLEKIIEVSTHLCNQKKAKLIIRLKDLDLHYEYESFLSSYNHKINTIFTNHASAMANYIALLQQCQLHKDIMECIVVSQDFLLLSFLQTLDFNFKLELQPQLNYPLYKFAKKSAITLLTLQYYTQDFTQVLGLRLKGVANILQHGIIQAITMHNNKQEWEKKCQAFLHSINHVKKEVVHDILKDSYTLFDDKQKFETFNYELQKPLHVQSLCDITHTQQDNTQDSKENNLNNVNTGQSKDDNGFDSLLHSLDNNTVYSQHIHVTSFVAELDRIDFTLPNLKKLEDILYLNQEDTNRLKIQGINNAPVQFSLHADKEQEVLQNALKKQEEILTNRLNIMTSIISRLKECMQGIFETLCHLYPHVPHFIFEEQVYTLIDTFKYYAYEYRVLLHETDSVLLIPIGNVFIHTKNLAIHEIASILASNIMIGNVSFLDDSILSRVFYYIFSPIFDFCPFMAITSEYTMGDAIHREIIAKKDISHKCYNNNLLVWDKGTSIVFISSFYDFHEAYLQVQNMRFFGNSHITIYTDEYIYNKAKQVFIPLQVLQSSLGDVIANISSDVSNVSLFTYNKTEMNYAIKHLKVSVCINGGYRTKLVSGSPRTFLPGYLQPFGSKLLLLQLLQTSPNSIIRQNSLYSDIIGCFNAILSVDEIEFLYNLNHNYSQFLTHLERMVSFDNIYEIKKPYNMCMRVYKQDDIFHVCIIMLIAFLLQIPTRMSFTQDYFDNQEVLSKLQAELQERYIDFLTLVIEHEESFLEKITPDTLVRILQDEADFSTTDTYRYLRKNNIIAEYSLPILNKNLELERYLTTQYIQIQPNFFLQTHVNSAPLKTNSRRLN